MKLISKIKRKYFLEKLYMKIPLEILTSYYNHIL